MARKRHADQQSFVIDGEVGSDTLAVLRTMTPQEIAAKRDEKPAIVWVKCPDCRLSHKEGEACINCPGVPIFLWDKWPEGLFTEKQIRGKGLLPGAKAGAIWYGKYKKWLYLYREDEATPKPPKTEKQIAAQQKREEALRIGWSCTRCGDRLRKYVKGGALCRICRDHYGVADATADLLAGKRGDFVIVDSETTGLYNAEIVQISIIDPAGKVLVDTLVKPIHPERLLERDDWGVCAADIHGITPDMLVDAPTFAEVYEQIYRATHGKLVVVYNLGFDQPIIESCAADYHLPGLGWADVECAMLLYAQFVGEWSDYWRDYRWQQLPGGDHSALGDCRATLDLLRMMAADRAVQS